MAKSRLRRFGDFVFDPGLLELSQNGRVCHLQPQPGRVLAVLVANAGRLVTRDELRRAVWQDDTFVDFDRGLNFCIAQIRAALGDAPDTPRFIRTFPKRGYEFVCPVEDVETAESTPPSTLLTPPRSSARTIGWLVAAVLFVSALGVAAVLLHGRADPPIVAVVRFDNETGDASFTRFSDQLTSEVIDQLTTSVGGRIGVIGNAAILRADRNGRDLVAIGRALGAAYVILGEVQQDGDGHVRVLAHLIRLPDQTHLSVSRTDGLRDDSLPTVDGIASRIAGNFAKRLIDLSTTSSSATPISR
jgi:DNA-binding winged helix-turn-helix (wHTH) protein/TolB-like protein